jgi:hypothetical protein
MRKPLSHRNAPEQNAQGWMSDDPVQSHAFVLQDDGFAEDVIDT